MKLTNIIHRGLAQLLLAVIGFASFSCSEDVSERVDDPNSITEKGISVTVATKDIATRALESFDANADDNELIHTCVVVFVNETSGEVAKVLKVLDLAATEEGVDKKDFSVFLKEGTYSAYAFANFSETQLSSLKLVEESVLTLADFEKLTMEVGADDLTSASLIPMSGYLKKIEVAKDGKVKLNDILTSDITITVVRMVGKLEFSFSNESTSAITITEISVKPKATGAVGLLPTWKVFAKTLESPDTTGVIRESLDDKGVMRIDSIKRNPTDFTIAKDKEDATYAFYVREVVSNHPTGQFPIRIKYKKENADEETLTALLYDLTEIKRNDWIRVPITLTDYRLKLNVEFYPPIGGYPPVTTAEEEDEYYVTFGTGGYFSIEAFAYKKGGTEIAPKNVKILSVAYDDKVSTFFRKKPTVDLSEELTGEIKSGLTDGATSVVTIKVRVTDGTVTKEFKRKIHFLYKVKKTT